MTFYCVSVPVFTLRVITVLTPPCAITVTEPSTHCHLDNQPGRSLVQVTLTHTINLSGMFLQSLCLSLDTGEKHPCPLARHTAIHIYAQLLRPSYCSALMVLYTAAGTLTAGGYVGIGC